MVKSRDGVSSSGSSQVGQSSKDRLEDNLQNRGHSVPVNAVGESPVSEEWKGAHAVSLTANTAALGVTRDASRLVSDADPAEGRATSETLSTEEFLDLLGTRVKERRGSLGMSRKQLAKDSGVSERYLAQLESGHGNISIKLLRQVSEAIAMDLSDLVRDKSVMSVVNDR